MDEFMPSHRENKSIETFCNLCKDLDSVTKMLQRDDMTLVKVRSLFDGVIEKFPSTKKWLEYDSQIVQDSCFELGIVKIQEERYDDLTNEEKEVTEILENKENPSDENPSHSEQTKLSFAEQFLKNRKFSVEHSLYIDTRFVLPTTNLVERLFSKAGHSLSSRRESLSPGRFEMQMFTYVNSGLWDISDVNAIIK